VDFEGFINYNTYAVANSTQFTFTIPQPIFNKRQITTSVIIWDGQTVVLGGLIREDNVKTIDKIPFLGDIPLVGRFFQSKTDSSTKRNLIIFLSARIVDPSGKPVREFTDARVTAPATQETP
jgi:general secretion pathway protein D